MSWRKFLPFRSSRVKEAFDHMTPQEKRRAGRLGFLYGIWIALTLIYPIGAAVRHPSPRLLVVTGILAVVGIIGVVMWTRGFSRFIASTQWAKSAGYKVEDIKLFAD